MGSTQLRKNGASIRKMTDKERRFCFEYLIDYSGTRAVIAAGYSKKGANVMAVKLLKRQHIKAYLGKFMKLQQEKFQIQSDEILWHLHAGATRNGKQYVDESGRLLLTSQNINDLPDQITSAIDSIKQKRKVYTDGNGVQVEEIETEVKLMPKQACLEMAMKHKGLFAEQRHDVMIRPDWDSLWGLPTDDDAIEVEVVREG